MNYHTPVFASEIVKILCIQPGKIYIDATLGNGGHTIRILKKGGIVYGIDQDAHNLNLATRRIKKLKLKNFYPIHANFTQLCQLIKKQVKKPSDIKGIIFDLGLSINQQTSPSRGFSFNDDQSLDMRLDPASQAITAEFIINTYPVQELIRIFALYTQEKFAKPLSLKIISQRKKSPIKTARRLSQIIRSYYQQKNIKTKMDPSTKVFLALRITVNRELQNLKIVLPQTLSCLPAQSIVAIISFHSGEDRIVKQFIKNNQSKLTNLIPKPIKAKHSQIHQNPLARSALLRAFQLI